ncbi:unnamed protein product, partial [Merluccius merluccius]
RSTSAVWPQCCTSARRTVCTRPVPPQTAPRRWSSSTAASTAVTSATGSSPTLSPGSCSP